MIVCYGWLGSFVFCLFCCGDYSFVVGDCTSLVVVLILLLVTLIVVACIAWYGLRLVFAVVVVAGLVIWCVLNVVM